VRALFLGFGNVARGVADILVRRDRYPGLAALDVDVVGIVTGAHGALVNRRGLDLARVLADWRRQGGFAPSHPDRADLGALEAIRAVPCDVVVEMTPLNRRAQGEPAITHVREALRPALASLLATDPQKDVRQVAMVDNSGAVAAWTGPKCIAAAGDRQGKGYSVQANLMDDPGVWPAMAAAYESATGDLAERLLATLEAAERAGGDIRGRQSAALVVVRAKSTGKPWEDRLVDLRVDDAEVPLVELRRLLVLHRAYAEMNQGDDAAAKEDWTVAVGHYTKAAQLAPQIAELPFWEAVTLFMAGREDEALPIFAAVFARDARWAKLVPRLPASGLLPSDPAKIDRILAAKPRP